MGVWHWTYKLDTRSPCLNPHFQALMCVMDCLIFTQISPRSHHTQPHITLPTSHHRPNDVCWSVPFALWVYGIGLGGFMRGLHGWVHHFQGLMCVMDCVIFTGSGTFHMTRSHTSHPTATPRDPMMCVGVFNFPCGCTYF